MVNGQCETLQPLTSRTIVHRLKRQANRAAARLAVDFHLQGHSLYTHFR
jgi:site-specific recombinase XerD